MITRELTDVALDWAVAEAAGMTIEIRPAGDCGRPLYVLAAEPGCTPWMWEPSMSWHHGGPIIEREKLQISPEIGKEGAGNAWWCVAVTPHEAYGPTPLIAAMRCFVASKLGDDVVIPEELLTKEN